MLPGAATDRETALLAAIILSLSFFRTPNARALNFDGSLNDVLETSVDAVPPAVPAPVPTPAPAPKAAAIADACKLSREARKDVKDAAETIIPELVSDVEAFALTPAEIEQADRAVPEPGSPLAEKLSSIMKRAYVHGPIEQPFAGRRLQVVTWNLNAAHTRKAVDALIAAFKKDSEGVREALGRKKAVSKKAKNDLDELARGDVYLLQEIPLPTAVELGKNLGMQVFWVPEFIEVGDNAGGRDSSKGEDFTGNAVMSRVPLSNFHILRYNNQADWYYSQKAAEPLGEKLKKIAASAIFAADPGNAHQTRPPFPYGGRVALFAQADVSGRMIWLPNLHLEDKPGTRMTGPELRCSQMHEALGFIRSVPGLMLFGGDLNTFGENAGIGEGEDLATEGANTMRPSQPPIDRQHGIGKGAGNKFFGAVDVGNLATTLAHNPGSRKRLVMRQSAAVAIDIIPYAPTIHDGLNAVRKVKRNPTPATITWSAIEVGSDFFPYAAVGYRGYQVFADERSRHNPSSRFNPDHHLFRTIEQELGVKPLNPRTGFRFGIGGYQSTWAAGRDWHLFNTVLDWLYLRDPDKVVLSQKSKVLKDAVNGSRMGSKNDGRLSDHYPLKVDIVFNDNIAQLDVSGPIF